MAHGQDLISHTMTSVYGMQPGLEDWFAAFETHQPLRTLFWYACLESRDGSPNPERLKKFWERAHQIAQAPEHIKLHQVRKDFSIRSKPIDVETTTVIDTLALYKPWTSEPIDRVPEFTGKQKRWTDALKDIAMEKEISVPRTISIRQKFMAAAIKVNPKAISHCHPKLADNPNFMMKAYKLSDKTAFLQALSPRLKTDKKFLTSLLDEYGYNEEFYTGLPTSVLQDYDMAAEILAIWPSFYEHLPNDMQISKDFANYLITNGRMTARALSHSCDVIKADQKLWRDAIRVEPLLLKFCQNGIEKDHHYILDVAQTKPEVLAHAKYFCRDKDFIIEAAKISSDIGPAIHGELLKDRKFLKELLMIDMDFRNYIDWDIREDPSFWEDVIRFPNCDYLDIHQGVRLREDFMRKALKIHPEWVNEELFAMDFDSKFLTEMYSKYPPKQPPPKKRFMCV